MQDPRYEDSTWAVLSIGQAKTVGRIVGIAFEGSFFPNHVAEQKGKDMNWQQDVIDALAAGKVFRVEDAFILTIGVVPVQMPDRTVAHRRVVQCMPEDAAVGPSVVYIKPDKIHLFMDMDDIAREEHMRAIKETMEGLTAARAARIGITLAQGPLSGR